MQNVMQTIRGNTNYPPASELDVQEAEHNIGFSFPWLLRELYLTVGNGGYGPDRAAMVGVKGGYSYNGTYIDGLYQAFRIYGFVHPDSCVQRYSYKQQVVASWPEYLLPIYIWGAPVYLCLDCSCTDGGIYYFDAADVREDNINDNVVKIDQMVPSFSDFLSMEMKEGVLRSKVERFFAIKRLELADNHGDVQATDLTVEQAADIYRKNREL